MRRLSYETWMNQILHTKEPIQYGEHLYIGEIKEKRKSGKNLKALMASILLVITVIGVFSVGFNSWNMTTKAVSQEEIIINNLPQQSDIIENSAKLSIASIDKNMLKEAVKQEEKPAEPVTKKVKVSNGKSYDAIATLSIPSLNINYSVLSTTSDELLKVALNKYWGANPNEVGNLCIVGHNYEDARFFGHLHKIKRGAEVNLTDMTGRTLTYKVYNTYVVDPYDTSCTSQLTNGNTEVTLITCYNDGKQRFVVKARVM